MVLRGVKLVQHCSESVLSAQALLYRRNQALERDWQQMLDEKFRLQMEAKALSQHLNALLNDKFGSQTGKAFDSDTPIDKALAFLQFIIAVCHTVLPCVTHECINCLHCLWCTCQQLPLRQCSNADSEFVVPVLHASQSQCQPEAGQYQPEARSSHCQMKPLTD